ncbi:MAG TPA: TatD family hydrolase [Aliarcobacter thereius]|uniref:TatD family deoxyribonuclease n=1 Tax=Aliarcobacter thereius TaxID=544718 RepID=A0A5R9H2U1_9BACT|nr:TatD family hydrolase [Aliarcobacter thereius]QBF15668.1 ssDNA/RNA exonuclease, 3' - 5' specific [Aliarcobacter thereius LMG 24486]TLS71474.1 TatD family deoxyribonuclease [Aliarcobacter thereius]TLS92547.1 TatD family deoxyribonuclease [Aliarcobacter thereius]TLT06931.1 TatD family deoxyribonuclease [Aliarcobacter thereius]HJE03964.1 TatD family hydrolase [Aliarcobacter thereius]
MIVDTHCHLDNEAYLSDIDGVIKNAKEVGVNLFIIPGADFDTLPRAIELSEKYDEVYFAVGTHPYDIEKYSEEIIEKYVNHPKCVAIGECGLDYYRLPEDEVEKIENIKKQKEVFISQIKLASKYKKPLIIHVREASSDSRQIIEEYANSEFGGVLHCYNASPHLLPLANMNFFFGIGGVLTFKNARKLVEILPQIPKDKLLIETDAPYLTPHPHRGVRNEPYYTTFVASKMAEILDISESEVKSITTQNSKKLFKEFSSII